MYRFSSIPASPPPSRNATEPELKHRDCLLLRWEMKQISFLSEIIQSRYYNLQWSSMNFVIKANNSFLVSLHQFWWKNSSLKNLYRYTNNFNLKNWIFCFTVFGGRLLKCIIYEIVTTLHVISYVGLKNVPDIVIFLCKVYPAYWQFLI